ncbi:hypothetical protein HDU92_001613 [Lobulomyces angularis]|nr:hypothetical protein HDU92_001613 [Lobulomyces angularis]
MEDYFANGFEVDDVETVDDTFILPEYIPKNTTPEWFNKKGENFMDTYQIKNGPSIIVNFIELMYLKKQFKLVIKNCIEYEAVSSRFPHNFQIKEVYDMKLRAILKIYDNEEEEYKSFLDKQLLGTLLMMQPLIDDGIYLIQAEAFIKLKKFNEALYIVKKYLDTRTKDFEAIIVIFKIFELKYNSMLNSSSCDSELQKFLLLLLNKILQKIIDIYQNSSYQIPVKSDFSLKFEQYRLIHFCKLLDEFNIKLKCIIIEESKILKYVRDIIEKNQCSKFFCLDSNVVAWILNLFFNDGATEEFEQLSLSENLRN